MAEYSIGKCIRTDKPVKRNGKYPIYLRVRVGMRETKIPTNIDVPRGQWDIKKREPKDKALLIQLNKKIAELDLYINRLLADGQVLTLDLVKNFYSGKRKVKPEFGSFFEYFSDFIERKRKEGTAFTTIKVYRMTFNILKEFRSEFKICDISLSLIEKFDEHMRDVNKNSPGGRTPKHKNLRTVILDIQKHNIPIENPYKWFKIPTSEAKEIFLDKSELNSFVEYAKCFDTNSKEYEILKMYQFSCFCGLRFSDAVDLKWKDIDFDNNLIRKVMIKTQLEVIAPLFPMARDILLERSNNGQLIGSSKNVFLCYSEKTVSRILSKHALLAGIDKHITYHSSRHTFATLLVMDNVDIYRISKYLGHTSVVMTQRYLKYNLSIAKESAKNITTFSGKND